MTDILRSLLGMGLLLFLAWALSRDRRRIALRTVCWGLGLQWLLGILILKTSFGLKLFDLAQQSHLTQPPGLYKLTAQPTYCWIYPARIHGTIRRLSCWVP